MSSASGCVGKCTISGSAMGKRGCPSRLVRCLRLENVLTCPAPGLADTILPVSGVETCHRGSGTPVVPGEW